MKTIEEIRNSVNPYNTPTSIIGNTWAFNEGFNSGVELAQRWIPIEKELPIAFESGNFDGLRSEFVIGKFKNGDWTKCRVYSGFMDGFNFVDWVDEHDCEILDIVEWRPIERK